MVDFDVCALAEQIATLTAHTANTRRCNIVIGPSPNRSISNFGDVELLLEAPQNFVVDFVQVAEI